MSNGRTKHCILSDGIFFLKDHGIFKMGDAIMLKALLAKSQRRRKP